MLSYSPSLETLCEAEKSLPFGEDDLCCCNEAVKVVCHSGPIYVFGSWFGSSTGTDQQLLNLRHAVGTDVTTGC